MPYLRRLISSSSTTTVGFGGGRLDGSVLPSCLKILVTINDALSIVGPCGSMIRMSWQYVHRLVLSSLPDLAISECEALDLLRRMIFQVIDARQSIKQVRQFNIEGSKHTVLTCERSMGLGARLWIRCGNALPSCQLYEIISKCD